jgi:hypothetical protein
VRVSHNVAAAGDCFFAQADSDIIGACDTQPAIVRVRKGRNLALFRFGIQTRATACAAREPSSWPAA